jgi:Domain of unknown function DUF29
MEELLILKELLYQGNIPKALEMVEELEEMGKSDKLNKIFSYGVVLLLHLIKRSAEKRTTRSWDLSIRNSVKQIQRVNQRHKAGGTYLDSSELVETLVDAYELALEGAAAEVFEGRYETKAIAKMIESSQIIQSAMNLILELS